MIPDNIEYLNSDGVAIMNNTNNIVITDDGLFLQDPLNSFTNGESFQCKFGDTTYEITINHIGKYIEVYTVKTGVFRYTDQRGC